MADGKVVIKGIFDSKDISSGVDSVKTKLASVSSTAASVSSSVMSSVASAAKAATEAMAAMSTASSTAVATGIGALTSQATSAYASYEQLVGGVDTLFKDASATVQDNAKNAYTTAGMSANDYMETVTSFSASLIQSLGGDTEAAAAQADVAIVDMSDNVNKMGSNIEDVRNAYQGFAKQNYTMLDNLKLGYGGTKEEMERLIADANKLREAQGEAGDLTIDSYSDVVTAIHLVQEEMGITGTTAAEASTTIEGSVNSAKATWTNWLTELGKDNADMGARTQELVKAVVTAAGNIVPRVTMILNELADVMKDNSAQIVSQLAAGVADNGRISDLGKAIYNCFAQGVAMFERFVRPEFITPVFDALANAIADLANGDNWLVNLPNVAIDIIAGIAQGISDNADKLIPSLFYLLTYSIENVYQNFMTNVIPAVSNILIQLGSFIATQGPTLIQGLLAFFAEQNTLEQLGNAIFSLFTSMLDFGIQMLTPENISGLFSKLAEFLQDATNPASELGGKLGALGSQIIQGIALGIWNYGPQILFSVLTTIFNTIMTTLGGLVEPLFSALGLNTGVLQISSDGLHIAEIGDGGSIEWHAGGGMFSSPQVIGVGEAGTEYLLNEPQVDAVASRINAQGASIDYNALGVAVANAIANTGFGFYVDSKQLASVTAGAYNAQSGRTQAFEMRWAR